MDKTKISPEYFKRLVGLRISSLLIEQNKTQKELAKYMGVKSPIVSYICAGRRLPNMLQVYMIAEFFRVTTDYILGLSQIQTNDCERIDINKQTGLTDGALDYILWANSMKESENSDNYITALNDIIGDINFKSLMIDAVNIKRFRTDEITRSFHELNFIKHFTAIMNNLKLRP